MLQTHALSVTKEKIIWLRCLTYDWFQVPTVFTSKMNRNFHLFSEKESWKHSVLKIAVLQQPKMVFTLLSQKYRR